MRGRIIRRSTKRLDSWTVIVDLGRDPTTGKRKQHSESVKGTRTQAERRLTELIHGLYQGIPLATSKLTVSEYLETWLRDVVSVRNAPRTVASYGVIVRKHVIPAIGCGEARSGSAGQRP